MLPAPAHTKIHIKLLQEGLREYFKQMSEVVLDETRSDGHYTPAPTGYNPSLEWQH